MIDPTTVPIVVRRLGRPGGKLHLASGDHGGLGRHTMPYCRTNAPFRTLEDFRVEQAGYAEVTGVLADCRGCAELVFRYPSWWKNHHPRMAPELRWI